MAGGKVAMNWELAIAIRSIRTARTSTYRTTPAFAILSAALHPIDPIFAKFGRCGDLAQRSFRKGRIQFLRTYGLCQADCSQIRPWVVNRYSLSSGHICFANTSGHFAGLRRAISYRATFASEAALHRTSQNSAEYRD